MLPHLKISSATGESEYLNADDLIVFIDETGEENFSDDNNPIFGLGGCAIMASLYSEEIQKPWSNLKEEYFEDFKQLHAADLYKPTQKQILAISQFFKVNKFLRFACIITRDAEIPSNFTPFQVVAISSCQRIVDLINVNELKPNRLFLLFEHSDRGNKLSKRYFNSITFKYENNALLPMIGGFVKKIDKEPGIEVADFIVHTAGAQSRIGLENSRKDFKSIFIDVDRNLMSYFLVNKKVEFTQK